jgi:D-alanyl-D-alanine carboxypeptidase (penicillin-binding protein 5/6)
VSRRHIAVLAAVVLGTATAPAHAAPPTLSAKAAYLVQPDTHDVIYQRNATSRRAIASTTKLMTALVSLDALDLRKTYTLPPYFAAAGESVAGLRGGERMTYADLLRAMFLPSANDAAHAIAILSAGSVSRFVARMNARAKTLGLTDSHFSTPIGLDDPGNYSSARDLVFMALLLRRNPFIHEIIGQPRAILHSGARERVVVNRNDLVAKYPFVDGVKTGHTLDAGYVLVGSATRDGISVVSAVLGDPSISSRDADTLALLRYGLSKYTRATAVKARQLLRTVPVKDQGDLKAQLVAQGTLKAVARRDERLTFRVVGAPKQLKGPLQAGTRVGTVQALRRGKVVGSTALVTARAIPKPTIPQRVRSWLSRSGTVVLLAFLAGCTVLLVLLRRRILRQRSGGGSRVQ